MAYVDEVINKVASERREIWESEPEDIKRLTRHRGVHNSRYLPIHVAAGVVNTLGSVLYLLRQASKEEEVSLACLKALTKSTLDSNIAVAKWLGMETLPQVLTDVVSVINKVESKVKYRELTEKLILYVKKVSCWIDYMIPWPQMNNLYEWLNPEKQE